MIFVTVGTTHFPFDRLMASVRDLVVDDEIVVQRGASDVTLGDAEVVDFLSYAELETHVKNASLVISHAGVGSIMVALSHGRRPLVAPRLARYGEAVDDHQVQVATMLEQQGRVTVISDLADLQRAVDTAVGATGSGGLLYGPLIDVIAEETRRAVREPH
jgi:UDP-N-acetylglucosamine transferase subunit ALG13